MKFVFRLLLLTAVVVLSHYAPQAFSFGGNGFGKKGMKDEQSASGPSKMNPEIIGAFVPSKAHLGAMERRGFIETGLVPRYPEAFDCPKAGSAFASPYRTDGSQRNQRYFEGLHGGLDIAQPKGTPLLAMADGEVVMKHGGKEGSIGGLGLWLRHAPEDTGLGKYVYIEYKHIEKLPDLEIGERVKKGQVVAHTGNTGTDNGGYYGYQGFYHLHMTAYWSNVADYKAKRMLIPKNGQWLDPLALFHGEPLDSHQIRALPESDKEVSIAFMSSDGKVHPEGTKVIWPYACSPR